MIITNAALRGREGTWDVHIENANFGSIVASPADSDNRDGSSDADLFDAAGRLVVEPFVDAHVHLDYSNTVGRPRPNESGTLFEAIEIWAERKEKGLNDFDEIYRNALAAARSEAANGTGFIRSHVDVTDPELTALKAILQLREDVKDWIEIQIVAFPQNTVLSFRDGPQLLEQALEMGADVIGGIPHNEGTPEDGVASLRIIFDLAEKYGVPIDVHCDEIDDEQSRFVEVMAAFASKRTARRSRDGQSRSRDGLLQQLLHGEAHLETPCRGTQLRHLPQREPSAAGLGNGADASWGRSDQTTRRIRPECRIRPGLHRRSLLSTR